VHHFFDSTRDLHGLLTLQGRNQAMISDRRHSMTTHAPAAAQYAAVGDAQERSAREAPAFDAVEFGALSEMIGEDGVQEMVMIFETETRQRLRRLTAGGQNFATLVREMHTLKGAAGTVASPRLAVLGRTLEHAAQRGIAPTVDHLNAIDDALEAFLAAVRIRNESGGMSGT
jgi:HPt (histidine-containing phosphotransfer) domain-containing protein